MILSGGGGITGRLQVESQGFAKLPYSNSLHSLYLLCVRRQAVGMAKLDLGNTPHVYKGESTILKLMNAHYLESSG